MLETVPAEFTDTPAWWEFRKCLPAALPTLGQAEAVYGRIQTALSRYKVQMQAEGIPGLARNAKALEWCQKLADSLSSARMVVMPLLIGFGDLAAQANAAVSAIDFRFLFDERHQVFHTGRAHVMPANTAMIEKTRPISTAACPALGPGCFRRWR